MPLGFSKITGSSLTAGVMIALCSTAVLAQDIDPPSRVARLNYFSGTVSMRMAEANDWTGAELNRPFSTGDSLYTDPDAQAELHTDVAAIRMGARTAFTFQTLNDQVMQIQLNDGDLYFRVHNLNPGEALEVNTPNATVSLLRDGIYRFRVDSAGGVTFVVVRQGTAEVSSAGQAVPINPGSAILISGSSRSYSVEGAPQEDEFDLWCRERDRRELQAVSTRYVPPTLVGYEDLDANGSWESASEYGPVWYPRAVAADWAPYRCGHWAWVSPWGWTWVDDARWGFAPFHYGRWVYVRDRWGWCPGPIAVGPPVRPHYAPALVAWLGNEHVGVSLSFGRPTTWVPLGYGEIYTPPYRCSQRYFNNVNIHNTRVVNNVNITNIYNSVYVNRTSYEQRFVHMNSPNAVMAMRREEFERGRPAYRDGSVVRREDTRQLTQGAPPEHERNRPQPVRGPEASPRHDRPWWNRERAQSPTGYQRQPDVRPEPIRQAPVRSQQPPVQNQQAEEPREERRPSWNRERQERQNREDRPQWPARQDNPNRQERQVRTEAPPVRQERQERPQPPAPQQQQPQRPAPVERHDPPPQPPRHEEARPRPERQEEPRHQHERRVDQ